jgi:hypothetical protein
MMKKKYIYFNVDHSCSKTIIIIIYTIDDDDDDADENN